MRDKYGGGHNGMRMRDSAVWVVVYVCVCV